MWIPDPKQKEEENEADQCDHFTFIKTKIFQDIITTPSSILKWTKDDQTNGSLDMCNNTSDQELMERFLAE